jgi:hypothetical protein
MNLRNRPILKIDPEYDKAIEWIYSKVLPSMYVKNYQCVTRHGANDYEYTGTKNIRIIDDASNGIGIATTLVFLDFSLDVTDYDTW